MSRTVCQEIIADMVCALPTAPRRGWLLRGTPQDPAPARGGEGGRLRGRRGDGGSATATSRSLFVLNGQTDHDISELAI